MSNEKTNPHIIHNFHNHKCLQLRVRGERLADTAGFYQKRNSQTAGKYCSERKFFAGKIHSERGAHWNDSIYLAKTNKKKLILAKYNRIFRQIKSFSYLCGEL